MSADEAAWPFGADRAIDALGLRCPLPVLKLEAAMRSASPGSRIAIRADDPIAKLDLVHAARDAGWQATPQAAEDGQCVYLVSKPD
ncbi:sulfurtransferase TusA family protein [Parvularcula dongshanensis]|uniref:tRNA 2-thiouridine synthesizing protein A n=1 Tax=Parvularcula dongshanensis TaxID=1173995 RepID=A0A840I2U4_9PROT|nr:tRNA 2-thiouridine synthesizing protein A [Parvularcula dongshanensis]